MPESAEPLPASGEGSRSAAGHATAAVPSAAPHELAGAVRGGLVGDRFESAEDVIVLEGGSVVGILPVERLLAAPADLPVRELMTPDPVTIAPDADEVLAAHRLIGRHESSLVVVDSAGRFRGLVPPSRMLPVLLSAHERDLARLGGYLAGARQARGAAEESVGRRLWHRLPWLLLGLLGAMGSALLVGAFEERLEANVLIAFFVPAVVYMADAVGTQTETVLIRALAAGVSGRWPSRWRSHSWPAALSPRLSPWPCRPRSIVSAATRPLVPGRWRRSCRISCPSPSTWRLWSSWSIDQPVIVA